MTDTTRDDSRCGELPQSCMVFAELAESADSVIFKVLLSIYFKLLQAEKNRALGNAAAVADLYQQPIDLPSQHRFVHIEALASEVAADFYLLKDNRIVARSYAEHARFAYLRWGQIRVESELCKGSTFYVQLPYKLEIIK